MISKEKFRFPEVDFLRGIAILMMAVFHFTWSLNHLGVVRVNTLGGFWEIFQTLTGGLFILLVGVSLTLSYSRIIKKSPERYPLKYLARGVRIFGYGLIITLVSWLWMPNAYVFFGILHFIGTAIILTTPFINFAWLNLFLGIAALSIGLGIQNISVNIPWLALLGFSYPVNTLDIYTVLPWISLVFFGLFIGNTLYKGGRRRLRFRMKENFLSPVQFLGRNSLLMYFLHLPLVYFIAWIIFVL